MRSVCPLTVNPELSHLKGADGGKKPRSDRCIRIHTLPSGGKGPAPNAKRRSRRHPLFRG